MDKKTLLRSKYYLKVVHQHFVELLGNLKGAKGSLMGIVIYVDFKVIDLNSKNAYLALVHGPSRKKICGSI
jgi:hypothetical protein